MPSIIRLSDILDERDDHDDIPDFGSPFLTDRTLTDDLELGQGLLELSDEGRIDNWEPKKRSRRRIRKFR